MNLIDVHAHLDFQPLIDKLDEVLQNAKNAGVKAIITNGVYAASNRQVLELAKRDNIIKPALGFYPTHVTEVTEQEFDVELEFIEKQKPIALGEVGLDYKFANERKIGKELYEDVEERKRVQKEAFGKIIALSEKMKIPMIIHSRKAELDVIEMLESSNAKKIVMHCFSGKKKLVKRIADNGWTFSVPVIVNKLQQFQEMVSETNMSQLLTETDSPYLGPTPGLTNEPKNVALTIKKIAELKGMTPEETADQIFQNYQRLFL